MLRSIRLGDVEAKKYGCRVLIPGTEEYAAYSRGNAKPEPKKEPMKEPEEGPYVAHEIRGDGTWVVTRDGEFFAEGDDTSKIQGAVRLAEAGHNPPDAFDVPGKPALEAAGISSMDDLRAYAEDGDLTDIDGIGPATSKKLHKLLD